MNVTIIHSNDCPKCAEMIKKDRATGIEPELYFDLSEIQDPMRRADMMADLADKNGDPKKVPLRFEDDKYMETQE